MLFLQIVRHISSDREWKDTITSSLEAKDLKFYATSMKLCTIRLDCISQLMALLSLI